MGIRISGIGSKKTSEELAVELAKIKDAPKDAWDVVKYGQVFKSRLGAWQKAGLWALALAALVTGGWAYLFKLLPLLGQ